MKITLTGSLGNITKPLTQQLVKAGHQVTVISSNTDKTSAIETLGAVSAIGSITDTLFLTEAFTGADAVYAMIPPSVTAEDFRAYANSIGDSYIEAIKASGVKRVVFLSSVGAQYDAGNGPIIGSHDMEGKLNGLTDVAATFIRPAFFYTNFFNNINMIKHMDILGGNYPADARVVFVHPADIAAAVADELQKTSQGKNIRYVYSEETTAGEAAKVLGQAIGKPELPWIEFPDEQTVGAMQQAGFSADMANKFAEMGEAVRNGIMWTDFDAHKPKKGNIGLEEFAAEFSERYKQAN